MDIINLSRLLLSTFLGALIGLERQTHRKNSGIRTMSLISLGSAVFSIISMSLAGSDPSRVIAQIVSGIGFLGAGIIFKSGMNIYGLTSAATIWCTAAVGTLCGIGRYQEAVVVTLLILAVNALINKKSKTNE